MSFTQSACHASRASTVSTSLQTNACLLLLFFGKFVASNSQGCFSLSGSFGKTWFYLDIPGSPAVFQVSPAVPRTLPPSTIRSATRASTMTYRGRAGLTQRERLNRLCVFLFSKTVRHILPDAAIQIIQTSLCKKKSKSSKAGGFAVTYYLLLGYSALIS